MNGSATPKYCACSSADMENRRPRRCAGGHATVARHFPDFPVVVGVEPIVGSSGSVAGQSAERPARADGMGTRASRRNRHRALPGIARAALLREPCVLAERGEHAKSTSITAWYRAKEAAMGREGEDRFGWTRSLTR